MSEAVFGVIWMFRWAHMGVVCEIIWKSYFTLFLDQSSVIADVEYLLQGWDKGPNQSHRIKTIGIHIEPRGPIQPI